MTLALKVPNLVGTNEECKFVSTCLFKFPTVFRIYPTIDFKKCHGSKIKFL
jgi:hypothetical protein